MEKVRLAGDAIEVMIFINFACGSPADSHEYGLGIIHEHLHEFLRHVSVRRENHVHSRECPEDSDVMKAVMCCAQCPVSDSAAHAKNLHRISAVCNIDFHLFEGSGHIETCRAAAEDFLSAMGQSGRYADCILFCDSTFHKLTRQFFCEVAKSNRAAGVCCHRYDVLVITGKFQQRRCKTFSAIFHFRFRL